MIENQNSMMNEGGSGNNSSKLYSKLSENKLIMNMKKQYKDLKKEFNKKCEDLEEIKKILKTTKLSELSLENKTLFDEINKLKSFYEISLQKNFENEYQYNFNLQKTSS